MAGFEVDTPYPPQSPQCERFHKDGFLVLDDVLEVNAVEELHAKAISNFHELESILIARNKKIQEKFAGTCMQDTMGIGIKHCFKEIVQRHEKRFEMQYKMDDEEFGIVLEIPSIMSIVKEILGDDCIVINKSLVVSNAGTKDQAWHSDGPHVSATEDLPCHCLNVFIPLVDVTQLNGPTQFRPGSVNMTRNLKIEMLKAMVRKTLRPLECPTLMKGSVLLFDYRVLHRGTANRSNEARPVLVYTFAKPFYRDTLNFPRNSVFDSPPFTALQLDSSDDENQDEQDPYVSHFPQMEGSDASANVSLEISETSIWSSKPQLPSDDLPLIIDSCDNADGKEEK